MANRLVYSPVGLLFMLLMGMLLFVSIGFLFLGILSSAFTRIGFGWIDALLLLVVSLVGSSINIPLTTLKSSQPIVRDTYVRVFGVTYRIPLQDTIRNGTTLAINFGGAIIPILVSIYLLLSFPSALWYALAGTDVVSIATHIMAKPVRGIGIVTPALLPPLVAALSAMVLTAAFAVPHTFIFIIAYISGTLGTLIGADLLNLGKIRDLGAPVASIGGAGTFDGVFLTGIIAVLLV
jgi:uncharacterized membrane protein